MKTKSIRNGAFAIAAGSLFLTAGAANAQKDTLDSMSSEQVDDVAETSNPMRALKLSDVKKKEILNILGDRALASSDNMFLSDDYQKIDHYKPLPARSALKRSGIRIPEEFQLYNGYDEIDEAAEILNGRNPDFSLDKLSFLPRWNGFTCAPYRVDGSKVSTMCSKSIFNDKATVSVFYDNKSVYKYVGEPGNYLNATMMGDDANKGQFRDEYIQFYGFRYSQTF